jgi:hypothetical protein
MIFLLSKFSIESLFLIQNKIKRPVLDIFSGLSDDKSKTFLSALGRKSATTTRFFCRACPLF